MTPSRSDPLFNVIATRQLRHDFREQPNNGSYRVEHVHGHNGEIPYRKKIPFYLAALPMTQVLEQQIGNAITTKNVILIATDTNEESSKTYCIGSNWQNKIVKIDLLKTIELDPSQKALQDRLRGLQEESRDKLMNLNVYLKKIAKTDEAQLINLQMMVKDIPFIQEYLSHADIIFSYKPSSLISLDGNLGKIHSFEKDEKKAILFNETHTLKLLSSLPHPDYHPEAKNTKKNPSSIGFFSEDTENIDPNTPERKKRVISTPTRP